MSTVRKTTTVRTRKYKGIYDPRKRDVVKKPTKEEFDNFMKSTPFQSHGTYIPTEDHRVGGLLIKPVHESLLTQWNQNIEPHLAIDSWGEHGNEYQGHPEDLFHDDRQPNYYGLSNPPNYKNLKKFQGTNDPHTSLNNVKKERMTHIKNVTRHVGAIAHMDEYGNKITKPVNNTTGFGAITHNRYQKVNNMAKDMDSIRNMRVLARETHMKSLTKNALSIGLQHIDMKLREPPSLHFLE